MFIGEPGDQWSPKLSWRQKLSNFFADKKAVRVMTVVLAVSLLLGIALIYWLVEMNKRNLKVVPSGEVQSSSQLPNLGRLDGGGDVDGQQPKIKAETLFFGNFYHQINEKITPKANGLALPTNIKQIASNYYPVDRQISLVNAFEQINKEGFAVIDNPFPKEANDFYAIYDFLNQKNLSYIVTNDFLIYYYQNALRNIFKTVEAEVFYPEFWEINKQMFEVADKRYRDRYAKVGVLNDPVLEGLRLESVYFGTMLEILKPKPKQILSASKDSVQERDYYKNYFSSQEAEYYSFTPPDYLADTIAKEMTLINRGIRNDKANRSPALLYTRDYREFAVPKEYLSNSRLNNFYLANVWANSLFPLYYKSADCPDCLLDREDWVINQAAAHLIARDFNANQDLKNRWAKIHKVIAFFSNLRNELTYLDYQQSFIGLFGDPDSEESKKWVQDEKNPSQAPYKTIEDIFDFANQNRDKDLATLQAKIGAYSFNIYKGGLDRRTPEGKQYSGMRMLTVSFDPTEYVYNQLIFDKVGPHLNFDYKIKDYENVTTCVGTGRVTSRCRAFGLDIINAVFDEPIKSSYFIKNTNYKYYGNQAPVIRSHFNGFDALNWNNNIYWASLDLSRQMLNNRRIDNFPYTQTDAWANANLDTALGVMLNSQLPVDPWSLAIKKSTPIAAEESIVKYNYVEPNLRLVDELIAKTQMVFDVFVGLDLVKSNNNEFNQMVSDFSNLKSIVIKELNGEDFYFKDWTFLNEFTGRYYTDSSGNKLIKISFKVPNSNQVKSLKQSISGVKLMVAAYHHQGRDLIAVGPIFNYKEVSD